MKGMSTEEYLALHERLCDTARELSRRKNHDYAAPDSNKDDPLRVFRNFTLVEALGICSTEVGFLVRLSDKFMRLCNLLSPGHERAVDDETIGDTILDMINYPILLQSYRKAKGDLDEKEKA